MPRALRRSPLEALVGNTPLVDVSQFSPQKGVRLLAKLEAFNPGGSVKDRPARAIVLAAARAKRLVQGATLVDATSGNTGIAYAMLGAAKGFRVRLFLPASASPERKRILRAYGAELVLTDAAEGSDGAIRAVRRHVATHPGVFYADQYSNPANPRSHYDTTAPEIWKQTRGRVTHFVAGLGTSGTLMGTGKRLRRFRAGLRLVAVQPDSPMHGLEGLKHMATAIRPAIFDPGFPDETLAVGTEAAQDYVRRLAREAGILAGVSSGAALAAAVETAGRMKRGVVVSVFPDGGDKYLSERFWDVKP